jgi:hypothetical protein
MIAITLNKEINVNWLVQEINKEINRSGAGEDKILYIEVKQISSAIDDLIPKLECKEICNEMPESTQNDN